MSKPIDALLDSFKDSCNLVEVYDSYTYMSIPPARHMRKSQVAENFVNNKISIVYQPLACLLRLLSWYVFATTMICVLFATQ
jgi:hypothetical protein